MIIYNWQQKDWPLFRFSLENVEDTLLLFSEKIGHVSGILETLPEETRQETIVDIILAEAIKTSEIEGEYHEDPMQVISGAIGKEKVHFEAPPTLQIPSEMVPATR